MLKKIIIALIVSLMSFISFYSESTDFEYSIFSVDDKIVNPKLLTQEQMIGQIANDYFSMKEINSDTVGWINIPNICYYPVMYTGDQYYLRRDSYKNYSYSGSIFMGKNSQGNFEDNALLYGHHMQNGTMFAGLKQYEFQDFFQSNQCIQIFDGKNLYYYKPYTVLYIKDGDEFIKQKGLQGEEKINYFKGLHERSIVQMEEGLVPDYSAQMLYLQTCEYLFNDCRLVVGCYLVKTIPYS